MGVPASLDPFHRKPCLLSDFEDLDALATDLRGCREERKCFANRKYQSRPSRQQVPGAVLVLEGKGRTVKGLGPHLRDEASSMPGRSSGRWTPDWGGRCEGGERCS